MESIKTMRGHIRILAVDDHKMAVMGYKYILEDFNFEDFYLNVEIETEYEKAQERIVNAAARNPYDILFLDIQLFPRESKDPRTGMHLALWAKQVSPESKIVFMSSFSDTFRINSIISEVDPDGYMLKAEVDEHSLREMVTTVLFNPPYYTFSVLVAFRDHIANVYHPDRVDIAILYELSKGTKTPEMAKMLKLSQSTIDIRKRKMREKFKVQDKNDLALIDEARKRGFI